jgi:uncharacterized YigZ family protein
MTNAAFLVPGAFARMEMKVSNSRFVASLDYVDSVNSARDFVQRIRAEFPDASHNVPAFIVGGGASTIDYCSDDGEPSGTSGKPILSALKGSGLGNAALVVTRYFGGTLLGTGGLVKAYSEAAKKVLETVARAELVDMTLVELVMSYHVYELFISLARSSRITLIESDFSESVRVQCETRSEDVEAFKARLNEISSGTVSPRIVGARRARCAV